MDKRALVEAAVAQLDERLAEMRRLTNDARAEVTHEETRPENDKDTRAIEASYLARGQAARVVELEDEIKALRFLQPRDFAQADPVALGALVHLDVEGERRVVFLVPSAGGVRVSHDGGAVMLVTPSAPLARALVGQRVGHVFALVVRGKACDHEIVGIE